MADFGPAGPHPLIVVSREELNRGRYALAVVCTSARFAVRGKLSNCVPFQAGSLRRPAVRSSHRMVQHLWRAVILKPLACLLNLIVFQDLEINRSTLSEGWNEAARSRTRCR